MDLRDHELGSLRAGIGLVAQEPFVFNGTVFENIALGRPDATAAEVVEAARAAGLEEFIASLPERYETVIGERGANLSGGQRQRLAIARALLRQAGTAYLRRGDQPPGHRHRTGDPGEPPDGPRRARRSSWWPTG